MPDPNRVPYSYDPWRQPVQPDAEVQGSIENVKPPPYSFAKFIRENRDYWSNRGMLGYVLGNTFNDLGSILGASAASTVGAIATLTGTDRGRRIGQRMNATAEAMREGRSEAYQNAGGFVRGAYELGEFVAPAAVGAGAANLGIRALNFGARAATGTTAGRTGQLLASSLSGATAEAALQGGQNEMEGGSFRDTFALDFGLNAVGAYGAGRYLSRNFNYRFNPSALFGNDRAFLRGRLDTDYNKAIFQRTNLASTGLAIPESRRFAVVEPAEQEISDYIKERRDEDVYANALAYSDY